MALFVASHYKNTPDDLQLLSDAPAHHIFCLLGPTQPDMQTLPEVLCVVQVCLEGEISKDNLQKGLRSGNAPPGDMIPWVVARQFSDENFPTLSGARIVRIATHPNYQSMGYGSRALELLQQYYEMEIPNNLWNNRVYKSVSHARTKIHCGSICQTEMICIIIA